MRAPVCGVRVPSAWISSNAAANATANLSGASATSAQEPAESFQMLLATAAARRDTGSGAMESGAAVRGAVEPGAVARDAVRSGAEGDQTQAQLGAQSGEESSDGQTGSLPGAAGSRVADTSAGSGARGTGWSGSPAVVPEDGSGSALPSTASQTVSSGLWPKMAGGVAGDADSPALMEMASSGAPTQGTEADLSAAQKKQKRGKAQSVAGVAALPMTLPAAVQAAVAGGGGALAASVSAVRIEVPAAKFEGTAGVERGPAEGARSGSDGTRGSIQEPGQGATTSLERAAGGDGGESSGQPGMDARTSAEGSQPSSAGSLSVQMADGALNGVNAQGLDRPETKTNAISDSGSAARGHDAAGGPSPAAAAGGAPAAQGVGAGGSPAMGSTSVAGAGSGPGSGSGAGAGSGAGSSPDPGPRSVSATSSVASAAAGAAEGGLAQASLQAAMTHLAVHDAAGASSAGSGGAEAARAARAEDPATSARAAAEESTAGSGVNAARVIQTMGQAEMRVQMRSEEFGDISIRTSISNQQMQAQISVDHSVLSQTLSTHVPTVQARLGEEYGLHASIEIDHHGAGLRGGSDGGSQQQGSSEGSNRSGSGRLGSLPAAAATESGLAAAVASGGLAGSAGLTRSGGLDIRV